MKPWITTDTFAVAQPWGSPVAPSKPVFDESDTNKKLYGIELGKGSTPYQAAQAVFPVTNGTCMWVAQNWPSDPIVNASKDEYLQALELKSKDLDKDALSAKVLEFVDEKWTTDSGKTLYVNEGKDRLAALKLYAEIKGFINNKTEINNTNNVNNTNNFVGIKLVKAETKDDIKTIDATPNIQSKILNNDALPQLKLVGGVAS